MKNKFLWIGIFGFWVNPLAAQACPPINNLYPLAYSRRDGNRCEGLIDRTASSSYNLVSLFTGLSQLNTYPSTLNIQVPGSTRPTIEIQSTYRNYRLDNLTTSPSTKGFFFPLNTHILDKADVPPLSLQALAYFLRDSQRVYVPVILGHSTGQYEFVIKSNQRVALPTFEIRRNDQLVYQKPSTIPAFTHKLIWIYGNAPQGIYKLRIIDNQDQSRTYTFEHNPNLL